MQKTEKQVSKRKLYTAKPAGTGINWIIQPMGGKTKIGEYYSGILSMAYGGWVFTIDHWPDLMELFARLDEIDKTRIKTN